MTPLTILLLGPCQG